MIDTALNSQKSQNESAIPNEKSASVKVPIFMEGPNLFTKIQNEIYNDPDNSALFSESSTIKECSLYDRLKDYGRDFGFQSHQELDTGGVFLQTISCDYGDILQRCKYSPDIKVEVESVRGGGQSLKKLKI
jgi:hypothetical protein